MISITFSHQFILPHWSKSRAPISISFSSLPYLFTLTQDRNNNLPFSFNVILHDITEPLHLFYQMQFLSMKVPTSPITSGDIYLSPRRPSFVVDFHTLQHHICTTEVLPNGSISLQFNIVSNVIRSFPLQPFHSGFAGIYPSRHIYLSPFLQYLFRIPDIFRYSPNSCALGGFVLRMLERPIPISSDSFQIDFAYSSIHEFISQFLELFASDFIKEKFAIHFVDEHGKQLNRLCLAGEESEFLMAASGIPPDILLVEAGEIIPETRTVIHTKYRLFAVLAGDENRISAFIAHEMGDRWTQIQDTKVQEISHFDFENDQSTRILSISLSLADLSWVIGRQQLHFPKSAPILETEISLKLILPGNIAEDISRGVLFPSIQSCETIGIESTSTFAQLYNRVIDWIQISNRTVRLWRFDDNRVIDRLPISDEKVVDSLSTVLVTFGYPNEIESDFFLYVAIFKPLWIRPPVQLLYTFCTKPDITFLELAQSLTEYVLQLEDPFVNVYIA
jgi:hypothetical protein